MLNLALGRRPNALEYKGDFRIAANFMLRTFETGKVKEVPSKKEIDLLKEKYPGMELKIHVDKGMHLSDMHGQDSYSFELRNIFVGALNQTEMLDIYNDCLSNLTFKITYNESTHVY